MGCADGGSRYTVPDRIIPAFGQVSENGSEVPVTARKESWYVLQECESGSNFANDANCVRPEVSLICLSLLLACNTPGLTRKPCADHVYLTLPLGPFELTDISEDGGLIQDSICDACVENLLAVFLPLDVGDFLPAQELGGQDTSTTAREQGQFPQPLKAL
jgi:hypothetical protein